MPESKPKGQLTRLHYDRPEVETYLKTTQRRRCRHPGGQRTTGRAHARRRPVSGTTRGCVNYEGNSKFRATRFKRFPPFLSTQITSTKVRSTRNELKHTKSFCVETYKTKVKVSNKNRIREYKIIHQDEAKLQRQRRQQRQDPEEDSNKQE